jgi:hypothetical protein
VTLASLPNTMLLFESGLSTIGAHPPHLSAPSGLAEPAVHALQLSRAAEVAPETLLKVPAAQPVHAVLSAAPHEPAGHLEQVAAVQAAQVADEVIPTPVAKVPALHPAQASGVPIPVPLENVPPQHCSQVAAEVIPSPVEKVPAPHAGHAASPVPVPYLPGKHASHRLAPVPAA